jgi:hypothetical protein
MEAIFKFLADNPFLLLFLTVGLAVWIGRTETKGMETRAGARVIPLPRAWGISGALRCASATYEFQIKSK